MKIKQKIKKFFNAEKWNEVKTRKKTLFLAVFFALTFTTIQIGLLYIDKPLDSTLTSEFFGFCKWLVGGGITITLMDKGVDAIKVMKDYSSNEEEIDELE